MICIYFGDSLQSGYPDSKPIVLYKFNWDTGECITIWTANANYNYYTLRDFHCGNVIGTYWVRYYNAYSDFREGAWKIIKTTTKTSSITYKGDLYQLSELEDGGN